MQRVRMRLALVMGAVAVVGACARSGNPAAPDAVQFETREVVATDSVLLSPEDGAVADSSGSRWGGFIGGGG